MKNWHGAHGPAHALQRGEQEAITHLTGSYPSFRMPRTAKPRTGLGYAGILAQMVPICSSTSLIQNTHLVNSDEHKWARHCSSPAHRSD